MVSSTLTEANKWLLGFYNEILYFSKKHKPCRRQTPAHETGKGKSFMPEATKCSDGKEANKRGEVCFTKHLIVTYIKSVLYNLL
jgi:hypothetical protein